MRVAGSRPQGPVGQVSRGLGARAPRAWGPAHQGPGPFPHKNHKLRFFRKPPGGSLAKAWVSAETAASEVGTWRETKPGYPPNPPPPPEEGFHPLHLRQPSNTPTKVGGYNGIWALEPWHLGPCTLGVYPVGTHGLTLVYVQTTRQPELMIVRFPAELGL